MNTHCDCPTIAPLNKSTSRPENTRLVEFIFSWERRLKGMLKRWRQHERDLKELRQLNDRDLRELGLNRIEDRKTGGSFFWTV